MFQSRTWPCAVAVAASRPSVAQATPRTPTPSSLPHRRTGSVRSPASQTRAVASAEAVTNRPPERLATAQMASRWPTSSRALPSSKSLHTRRMASAETVASPEPSAVQATPLTRNGCRNTARQRPSATSQTRAVPSSAADASRAESGAKQTAKTRRECPRSSASSVAVSIFQRRIAPSPQAAAILSPPAAKATPYTFRSRAAGRHGGVKTAVRSHVFAFQRATVPSADAVAMARPSGANPHP